jgi:ABC-type branched-subunit amino acid transport system permease subunit
MRIRLTNGIWIGIVVTAFQGNIYLGMFTTACLEIVSIIAINIFWLFNGYKELKPGSFMSSVILPNTSPKDPNFAYQFVLFRIYLRAIALICILLWPGSWPMFLTLFILTLLHK